jgi:hypothetical protein
MQRLNNIIENYTITTPEKLQNMSKNIFSIDFIYISITHQAFGFRLAFPAPSGLGVV